MKIDVCFSPILYPYYVENTDTIVVVVDIFRATTTMCMALNNGAASIMPVATVEEAKAYKEKGYLVGGERNVVKFEFGDFGNTPSEYTREKVEGKDVVISTTNGTHAIDMAEDCSCLIIGSFSNISTVADFCLSQKKDVLVLCAGWKDKFNLEDSLFGGALAEILVDKGAYNANFDAAGVALSMWKEAKPDILAYIKRGEHMKRLEAHGLLDVADFCLQSDTTPVLPIYNKNTKKISLQ
ncbi:2-phosphosulfolactate phosphatase [Dysgonomonas alginatilytica]|uniref:Probable 2-phosphosulfolactate phosphatase n=1 Tax=Dysgonomonas alginatilytica TaxID=1605892 RepID=A0A2V3PNE5_9BACT|nr:2-phosphosulfolactate phosphatase [Dysgonomonas alginatilytica]PXV64112.1 2-phosphosulfolactate phosphatase [Dysgonomonas alginatilytica]